MFLVYAPKQKDGAEYQLKHKKEKCINDNAQDVKSHP